MVPPQVSSVARKPLSIGFEEIAADKIKWVDPRRRAGGRASSADAADGDGDVSES